MRDQRSERIKAGLALRVSVVLAGWSLGAWVGAAQMPAGAHSVDDHSREDAAAQQVQEAETALEKGDFKAAEVTLKALATARPRDARVLFDLGFAQDHNGEDEEAAASYAAAIAVDGSLAEPKAALGLLDARRGRTEAAHAVLLEVARMTTAAPELRGRALRALATMDEAERPDDAREELLAALKLTAETPADGLMTAELAAKAGDAEDAETAFRRALARTPGDIEATAGLAHVLLQEKKTVEAEALLQDALKQHPDDVRMTSQLADAEAAEGQTAEAVTLLEGLRTRNPSVERDPAVGRMLARLYAMNGDPAKAVSLYTALAEAKPTDPYLLDDLGSAEVKLSQFGAAEATLTRAAALRAEFHDDDAWGDAEAHLAFAASRNNHPELVLQALSARATVLPNTAVTLFLEATAHDTLHQSKPAAAAYRAFLALADGKFPDQEFQARHRLAALEPKR
jgi:Flp pilus assembly protein TadD